MPWKDPHEKERGQDLLPEEIQEKIPHLSAKMPNYDDVTPVVKFFTPMGSWTWYVMAWDPEDQRMFGLVDGLEPEFGMFDLNEMATLKHERLDDLMLIERDMYWTPKTIGEIMGTIERPRFRGIGSLGGRTTDF